MPLPPAEAPLLTILRTHPTIYAPSQSQICQSTANDPTVYTFLPGTSHGHYTRYKVVLRASILLMHHRIYARRINQERTYIHALLVSDTTIH